MLSGTVECPNVCDPQHANTYPLTHKLLLACAKALQCPAGVHAYATILGDIAIERGLATPGPRLMEAQLAQPPQVRLVKDLKNAGERLWGCIAKDDQDVAIYGAGICLNSDMTTALESTKDPFVIAAASTLICVTYAHERMHTVHHAIYPQFRLDTTPPSIGGRPGEPNGESGLDLEEKLFRGTVEVTWRSRDRIGDFAEIERITARSRYSLHCLTLDKMDEFLRHLYDGEISAFPLHTMPKVPEAIPPMVSTRGLAIVQPPNPSIGLDITLGPDAVTCRVGADRLPYILPIYHDGRPNWTDLE
ncbi:hypothetical protein C8F01DRAFT_13088 [Mycena amicta]|nr:hypothetical protein C8F01DRAFT_13088 [Mycena amicta]